MREYQCTRCGQFFTPLDFDPNYYEEGNSGPNPFKPTLNSEGQPVCDKCPTHDDGSNGEDDVFCINCGGVTTENKLVEIEGKKSYCRGCVITCKSKVTKNNTGCGKMLIKSIWESITECKYCGEIIENFNR